MTAQPRPLDTTPTKPPASDLEAGTRAAILVERDVLQDVLGFAEQLCVKYQLPHPVQERLITKYSTRRDILTRQLQVTGQLKHLADLEQARMHLIQTYHSQLAEITTKRVGVQTAVSAESAASTQSKDPSSLPHLVPMPTNAAVHFAPAIRKNMPFAVGWLASTIAVTWSVTAPQYVLSVIPHVPLFPIMFTIGLGLLMVFVTARSSRLASRRSASVVGLLYALLVWTPFLATWILCSHIGSPTWPAAFAGLVGPTLMLTRAYHRTRPGGPQYNDATSLFQLPRHWSKILALPASLFYGYGSLILAVFVYTAITRQPFGTAVVANLGVLILVGAALSSGIFSALQRSSNRQRARGTSISDASP